ncbi:MAG: response regulator [Planctomycetes bacterium]|nr:response regulator [Planctomycetota bacterium]
MNRILIADDDAPIRITLKKKLEGWGYEPILAENGEQALEILTAKDAPRIAILDWMMPKLCGVDVCKSIEAMNMSQKPYLILLTQKDSKQDMVTGLESGADDYICKPFEPEELKCRIEVGRRITAADDKIHNYAQNMESLAEDRAKQLIHCDRLAQLGILSAGIAHEINNPVGVISGNAQIMTSLWKDVSVLVQKGIDENFGDTTRLKFVQEETADMLRGILDAASRINLIISSLKTFCRRGSEETIQPCMLNECIDTALVLCKNTLKYTADIVCDFDESIPHITGNKQQIEQVLVNLFNNASDALSSIGRGKLTITTKREGDYVTATIADNGPGIPEDKLDRIWEPFFTTKGEDKGTGLGLSISKNLIESHGGFMDVCNLPDGGACFTLRLPVAKP